MTTFTVNWIHIPTSKRGQKLVDYDDVSNRVAIDALLRDLNTWNGQQPGVWVYWW